MESQGTKIIVITALIIIFSSVALYSYYNKEIGEFDFNGFAVKELSDSNYQIELFLPNDPQPHYIYMRNDPNSLNNIDLISQKEMLELLIVNKSQVYYTMDPTLSSKAVLASIEISKFTANKYFFNLPAHGALTEEHESGLPFITCQNVTKNDAVVWLRLGKENRAYSNQGCVILEGTNEDDLIRVADAFALKMIGIIR